MDEMAAARGTGVQDAAAVLRAADLRVTGPRVAVLDALATHPHSDADAISRLTRARLGAVSTQAVYDVLRALTTAGLVRRIEPAGSAARYELRVGDNHHHLVCRDCGAVTDVDCAVGSAPCLVPSVTGFAIDEAEVTYWGLCEACASGVPRLIPAQPDATTEDQAPPSSRAHPTTANPTSPAHPTTREAD